MVWPTKAYLGQCIFYEVFLAKIVRLLTVFVKALHQRSSQDTKYASFASDILFYFPKLFSTDWFTYLFLRTKPLKEIPGVKYVNFCFKSFDTSKNLTLAIKYFNTFVRIRFEIEYWLNAYGE